MDEGKTVGWYADLKQCTGFLGDITVEAGGTFPAGNFFDPRDNSSYHKIIVMLWEAGRRRVMIWPQFGLRHIGVAHSQETPSLLILYSSEVLDYRFAPPKSLLGRNTLRSPIIGQRSLNIGPLISRWELDKFKNC
jgi:hypothetical protein